MVLVLAALTGPISASEIKVGSDPFYFADDTAPKPSAKPAAEAREPEKKAPENKGPVPLDFRRIKRLAPGRYRGTVDGVLCNACTRAIVENLKELKHLKEPSFDFEEGALWFTIEKGADLRFSKVLRAINHAGSRVGFGNRLKLTELQILE